VFLARAGHWPAQGIGHWPNWALARAGHWALGIGHWALARAGRVPYIVSGCMGMIKSRSIIPHSPTDYSRLPTPYHSGVTGIDITFLRKAIDGSNKIGVAVCKKC